MTRATCAICGWRDATALTEWDGRAVPACADCSAPKTPTAIPNEFGQRQRAILRAARFLEVFTTAELCDYLEIPIDERNSATILVRRQWKLGRFERLSGGPGNHNTTYRLTEAGRRAA